jgi:hypothetical protein
LLATLLLMALVATARGDSKATFTFAVLGDNRGDPSGELSRAFEKVLTAVGKARPMFVLNTGDMIYGHTNLAVARREWQLYRQALAALRVPVYHVPGNHDIWDAASEALYREICGPTYFAFDYGSVRVIGLDTESSQSRLGTEQFNWLKRQLAESDRRMVFLMLHRPLFPADGAIGSSLDAHPTDRDELHRLFVKYRDSIKAVFVGHEHGFHFEERDGVHYYTTAGGGANLYEVPELGGFYHFMLVHVSPTGVEIELRKVGTPAIHPHKPLRIKPGALLESWEQGLLGYTWDYTVSAEITSKHASEGARGLQLNFDPMLCPWPVLVFPLSSAWDLQNIDSLAMDVYLPRELNGSFTLTPELEGAQKFSAPGSPLRPGWNTVRAELNGTWLPKSERRAIRSVEWGLESRTDQTKPSAFVVFDNFRSEAHSIAGAVSGKLLEGWERTLLWRLADETVTGEIEEQFATHGKRGLKLAFDFLTCVHPVLLARLDPPWDLRKPTALALDIFAPDDLPAEMSVGLGLRAHEVSHVAPRVALHRGWNKVTVDLSGDWLPNDVRAAAEQIEWRLYATSQSPRGWLVFDNLRAEGS